MWKFAFDIDVRLHELQHHMPQLLISTLGCSFFYGEMTPQSSLNLISPSSLSNVLAMNNPPGDLIEDLPYQETFLSDHLP